MNVNDYLKCGVSAAHESTVALREGEVLKAAALATQAQAWATMAHAAAVRDA